MLLAAVGCTSSQPAGGLYRADLGRAPDRELLVDIIGGVLQSYGYQIRSDSPTVLETEWRTRTATPTEYPTGVARVRDRARIFISRRGRDHFVARMTVEHEVVNNAGRWVRLDPSERTREQYAEIETQIVDRLQQYMTQN